MRQYKELVSNILSNGQKREDRTGTGTISVFGTQTRYDLQQGFPLLTTKKVNFKAIVAELLWLLSGSTNINDLDSKIWNEWGDEHGNLGPIYGHQWRNWGGSPGSDTGIDQIEQVIHTIKTNPMSRRIIVSAWNVGDLHKMALPPCHMMFQFYVRPGYLDCQMYQRSADVALGVPFNIASYALLVHLIANECNLLPGELIHTIGDAHAYTNHVEGLREQMERQIGFPPRVIIKSGKTIKEILESGKSIDEILEEDIRLTGYNPHPRIRFEVSV